MTLAFLGIGTVELFLILISLLIITAIGNYGKNTVLGYWGSVLLAILTTPVIAFIVVWFFRTKKTASV